MTTDADHIQRVMKANLSFARAAGHVGASAFAVAASATKEMTGFSISDFIPVVAGKPIDDASRMDAAKERALALLACGPLSTSIIANRVKISPDAACVMMNELMKDGQVTAQVGQRKYRGEPVTIWSRR